METGMTLRHYKIFAAVCDTMNMTAAAEALFISQPAVSQAVAELENHYGVLLFDRLSRKLYLTPAGQKLLGYTRPMLQMHGEIESDMKSLHRNGSLRIGASVTVGACVLPGLMAAFQKGNPRIEAQVIEDNTAQIESLLLQDQIDLGLVEGETFSQEILSRPFLEDELVLICAPGHRFAACPIVEPGELADEAFMIREKGSGTRKAFEDKMAENGLQWKACWTCNNADTIKNAVAAGLGVSVISRRAVMHEVKAGLLLEKQVAGLAFKRQFKLVWHKNKYITKPMEQFIKELSNSLPADSGKQS